MEETVHKVTICSEEIVNVRKKLPRGSGKIIADMLNDQFKPETINHMIRGHRSMSPIVLEAA